MSKNILVVGFYNKGNIGDEAFKLAIGDLWGESAAFTFCSMVPENVDDFDAVWIGGGSLLDVPIQGHTRIKDTMPVAFVGVGVKEGTIHPVNMPFLARAKATIVRNDPKAAFAGVNLAGPVFYMSDLVFARHMNIPTVTPANQPVLTVLGNDFLVPRDQSADWKKAAWEAFVPQITLAIQNMVINGFGVTLFPMQTDSSTDGHDDRNWVTAAEIQCLTGVTVVDTETTESDLLGQLRVSDRVWSMRLHGNIYSTIMGVPFVGICSHTKMFDYFNDNSLHNWLDYYSLSAENLYFDPLPGAAPLLMLAQEEHNAWHLTSATMAEALGL